jgi:protein-S-isoprenylcysteine O-methyltransferase Ste14
MTGIILAIAVVSQLLLVGSLVLSILSPAKRIWPPPGRGSWEFWFTWTLTVVALTGGMVLAFLDWNHWLFPHWMRLPVGGLLTVAGISYAVWGLRTLGSHASLGLGGQLVSSGPYRYSRNPEYVGDIVALLGYAIVCNSLPVLVVAVLGAAWFALAPHAEEPWLRRQLGASYEEYVRRVPRFIGFRRPSRGGAA